MDYILNITLPPLSTVARKQWCKWKQPLHSAERRLVCQWVGVFVLIFHMTLIIHWKVKGKGMMNFKCRQEDQCSKDKLVSFPGCKLSLSSLDTLLLAVTGPVCLYQHLATIFLPHTHTHICSDEFVHQHTHLFSTISFCGPTLSPSLSPSASLFPASPFLCASALVISRYI